MVGRLECRAESTKKTTHHPLGQQVVLYQISSNSDETCRKLVQNWYRAKEIYILFHFIQRIYVGFYNFTAQSASSWGQVKEHARKALYSVISLLMRLPFCPVRTLPYATLHKLPRIWCKSGVAVGVVRLRWKCPVYRSIFQRNGLWLPWWLPRKSPSWC